MVKINAIKQQQKRSDRYSIYGDDAYLFALSEAELLRSGLRVGQELNESELLQLKHQAVLGKAYDRALNLISHRPRSERELRDYLKRKDYDQEIIRQTIAMLRERGYINDSDFARRWVESRRLLKPTSKRRLTAELRQKGIAGDIIEQIMAKDTADEKNVLHELIVQKRKQTKYQDNLKLMQYLSRQGFNYEDIKNALDQA